MWSAAAGIFLALFATATSQGNLDTFARVKEALLEGSELILNANSETGCDVTNFDFFVFDSMPLRQWQIIRRRNGQEEIRADDFYLASYDPDLAHFFLRTVNILDDDSVRVTISEAANQNVTVDPPVILDCMLGAGAEVHKLIPGNDITTVDTYTEVKTYLLLGDHVEAVGYLTECQNSDDIFQGVEYTVGYQIQRFSILNEGTPSELIVFDDNAALSANGTSSSLGTEQVVILPDGSASVTVAIYDTQDISLITEFVLNCQLGSGLKFTVHNREQEDIHTTYATIKDAVLAGHDMETIVFIQLCEVLEGPPLVTDGSGYIVSARFDEAQLFKAGELWGDQEHIAFSTWGIDVTANLFSEIARVYEDDSVTLEYHVYSIGTGETVSEGKLSCPLFDATLFFSIGRTRAPVNDFSTIVNDVMKTGQIFDVEIDYDACNTGGVPFDSMFSGLAWQTYVDPDPDQGYWYAPFSAIVIQNTTGTPGPAWDAARVFLNPDGSVLISPRLYDFYTGEDLLGDMAPPIDPIVCELGNGVSFYRYP